MRPPPRTIPRPAQPAPSCGADPYPPHGRTDRTLEADGPWVEPAPRSRRRKSAVDHRLSAVLALAEILGWGAPGGMRGIAREFGRERARPTMEPAGISRFRTRRLPFAGGAVAHRRGALRARAATVTSLQRTAGNAAVCALLSARTPQPAGGECRVSVPPEGRSPPATARSRTEQLDTTAADAGSRPTTPWGTHGSLARRLAHAADACADRRSPPPATVLDAETSIMPTGAAHSESVRTRRRRQARRDGPALRAGPRVSGPGAQTRTVSPSVPSGAH